MHDPLSPHVIAADVCVMPQLTPEAMTEVARLGFRSVIGNRPDFEHGPDQPTSVEIERAATAAGLIYRHLPVAGNYQSPQEIAACRALLDELPRPLLMFCRTGGRSAKLYALAMAQDAQS